MLRALLAYCLASALGRCRLFGVDLGADDATLTPEIAHAAVDQAVAMIARWTVRTGSMGDEFDAAVDATEGELCCEDRLVCRMDCWAAMEIVLEAALAATEDEDPRAGTLHDGVARLGDAIGDYDAALQQQVDLLTVVCGTGILDEWRDSLAPEYAKVLPWWLDGTLERAAKSIEEYAEATQPSPAMWRRLHGRDAPARDGRRARRHPQRRRCPGGYRHQLEAHACAGGVRGGRAATV